MGHGSTPSDPWPMWPIRFSWPIWPMTHDPSTHSLLWVPYSITSVGQGADPGFLAVSPQVTLVLGCRYFPPGPRSLSQPNRPAPPWLVPNDTGWRQRHTGVNSLPKATIAIMPSQDSNPRPVNHHKSVALPIAPRHHLNFLSLLMRPSVDLCALVLSYTVIENTAISVCQM